MGRTIPLKITQNTWFLLLAHLGDLLTGPKIDNLSEFHDISPTSEFLKSVYLPKSSKINGNLRGPPPKATPPQEIAGLIKGLFTIGFP